MMASEAFAEPDDVCALLFCASRGFHDDGSVRIPNHTNEEILRDLAISEVGVAVPVASQRVPRIVPVDESDASCVLRDPSHCRRQVCPGGPCVTRVEAHLSLIHISEPTRRTPISYAVFC